jgi:hypothetical protein
MPGSGVRGMPGSGVRPFALHLKAKGGRPLSDRNLPLTSEIVARVVPGVKLEFLA